MAINGIHYDWESMEIQLPSGVAIGITEISYQDERGIEARYGKGVTPRGFGRKNYKASGSMTLDKDEAVKFRNSLGDGIYHAKPFPVVVAYANADQATIADTLPDVKVTKADTSGKQDDDNVGIEKFDFVILSPILWNGKAAI